jgi:hypothetical protein
MQTHDARRSLPGALPALGRGDRGENQVVPPGAV